MTSDELRRLIDCLQKKNDEKMREAEREADARRGAEAFGMARGLAFAIGALSNYLRDE